MLIIESGSISIGCDGGIFARRGGGEVWVGGEEELREEITIRGRMVANSSIRN